MDHAATQLDIGPQPRLAHGHERVDTPRPSATARGRPRRAVSASGARYLFIVRQSQPASAAISA
jgi:hypothetical protein